MLTAMNPWKMCISETIYAIKEGNECLLFIFGDVGLGKTFLCV